MTKKKITIIIEAADTKSCDAIIKMIAFMADPQAARDWKATITITDE